MWQTERRALVDTWLRMSILHMHSNGCGIFDASENIAWYCLIHSGLAETRGGGGEFLFILSFFCCCCCSFFSFIIIIRNHSTSLQCCKNPGAPEIA